MRIRNISKRRALGFVMAAALALGATTIIAGPSEAAVPGVTLKPATGAVGGGTIVTVTGKGFADSTGTPLVVSAFMLPVATACPATGTVPSAGASVIAVSTFSVVSATKLVLTSPVLTGSGLGNGTYNLCLYDKAAAATGATVIGTGKFAVKPAPTVGAITPNDNAASPAVPATKAAAVGGTTVALAGANFTKTSKVTVDGVAAGATYVSDTKLSVKLPAHSPGTGYKLVATTEYGSATTTGTVTYVQSLTVSPTGGTGAVGDVLSVTGKGFNALTLDTSSALSAGKSSIILVAAGTALDATGLATGTACVSVQRESDSEINCKLPTGGLGDGAYTVVLATMDSASTPAVDTTNSSGYSKSATYTVADF